MMTMPNDDETNFRCLRNGQAHLLTFPDAHSGLRRAHLGLIKPIGWLRFVLGTHQGQVYINRVFPKRMRFLITQMLVRGHNRLTIDAYSELLGVESMPLNRFQVHAHRVGQIFHTLCPGIDVPYELDNDEDDGESVPAYRIKPEYSTFVILETASGELFDWTLFTTPPEPE